MKISLILKSYKDFLSPFMLKLSLAPFLGAIIIIFTSVYLISSSTLTNSNITFNSIKSINNNGIIEHHSTQTTIDKDTSIYDILTQSGIGEYFNEFDIDNFVISSLTQLSIIIGIIIVSFLTPRIIDKIHQKYYSDIKLKGFITTFDLVWMILKTIFIMIFLFFIMFPLYFIPYINIIALHLPFYYLFHKLLIFDVGSYIHNRYDYALMKFSYKSELRVYTLLSYIISLIPIAGVILSAFYIILITHIQLNHLKEKTIIKVVQ